MKYLLTILICLTLTTFTMAQTENPDYDPELAASLGADEYGMKSYVLVILKTGSVQIEDQEELNSIFKGHLDNITQLAEIGKLSVAGPLGNNENNYRGIFILNVDNLEEAEKLLQTDPAVKEGVLDAELYSWYGSAALPLYLETAKKISKIKF